MEARHAVIVVMGNIHPRVLVIALLSLRGTALLLKGPGGGIRTVRTVRSRLLQRGRAALPSDETGPCASKNEAKQEAKLRIMKSHLHVYTPGVATYIDAFL